MQTASTLGTAPENINPHLGAFEAARDEYLERQADFRETIKETERMRAAAAALQAEAKQAVASWKGMAVKRHVEQAKISAEMKRADGLQQQADDLIRTADAREELRKVLAVELAKVRFSLHGLASRANASFRAGRLRELLATPGLKEAVNEIYAICRYNTSEAASAEEMFIREVSGTVESVTNRSFIETLGLSRIQGCPVVASVPAPVAGEVTASSSLALKRFVEAGGDISRAAILTTATPSKAPAGLKQH
jgi:hypothetical protein